MVTKPDSANYISPAIIFLLELWLIAYFGFSQCRIVRAVNPEPSWGYGKDRGPDTWCQADPQCCGLQQSPIDVNTSVVVDRSIELRSFDLDSFITGPMDMTVTIDGHTAIFKPANASALPRPLVWMGGCLQNDQYVLEAFHFHWGQVDKEGSEHKVNGMAYPMEMHMLSRNARHASLTEAVNEINGLAAISVMIKVADSSPEDPFNTAAYQELTSAILRSDISDRMPHGFKFASGLRALLPKNVEEFYCYSGSLTTPHCNEVVRWTLMKTPIIIASGFLDRLRQLPAAENDATPLESNFRPVQQLNGRQVYARLLGPAT